jgi:membrane-associated protease RseP (regulator of RpoE activity)
MTTPTADILDHSPVELSTPDARPQGVQPGSWKRLGYTAGVIAAMVAVGWGPYLVALSVLLGLILLHEAGHFSVAKACRMRVHQFFVGFGPVIWSVRRGETEYGIKAIPLGGFVRIAGMTPDEADDPRGYKRAGLWQRLAVIGAGPATNFVIAIAAGFIALWAIGLGQASTTIAGVDARLPAAAAGLRAGDEIVAIDGVEVESFSQVTQAVLDSPDEVVAVAVRRGETMYLYSMPIVTDAGQRKIGIFAAVERHRLSPGVALEGSINSVSMVAYQAGSGLWTLVTGFANTLAGLTGAEVPPENRPLSPVGAVQVGVAIGGQSMFDALGLVMLYSTFLAVFNLLPIPPLDGGHMVIAVVERAASKIRRRTVEISTSAIQAVTVAVAGFLIMLGLVALVLDFTQPVIL